MKCNKIKMLFIVQIFHNEFSSYYLNSDHNRTNYNFYVLLYFYKDLAFHFLYFNKMYISSSLTRIFSPLILIEYKILCTYKIEYKILGLESKSPYERILG